MITINPGEVNGIVHAPSSKSEFQRVLALSALSENESNITFTSKCNDVNAAIEIIKDLGCIVNEQDGKLTVKNTKKSRPASINCGESGLLARLFSPVGALLCEEIQINGQGSLLERDMSMVAKALKQLNSDVRGNKIPIEIKGRMSGDKNININGSSSSQLLTGLLMSLPFLDAESTTVNVENLTSKPYIDLTIDLLNKFGIVLEQVNYNRFVVPGRQKLQKVEISIEGDWSGAAFILVAGAIAGNITLKGLNLNSCQADKEILTVLKLAGANIEIHDNEIKIEKSPLKGFIFDATNCPDLFPPMAVLAAYGTGYSAIKGANRLLNKESNRIESLMEIFTTLGIEIIVEDNIMVITGGKITGGKVSSHNDHRIAMAAAIAALGAEQAVTIENHEAVNKSFPDFFKTISQIQNR